MRAFDASRYSTGNSPVSIDALSAMYRDGIRLAVPGCWHGNEGYDSVAETLRNSRQAGLLTATYIALTPAYDGYNSVMKGYSLCGAEWQFLRFVALDVEVPGITREDLIAAIKQVVALGQRPIIYTSRSAWNAVMNDSFDFWWLPLWDAHYTDNPLFGAQFNPYGNWSLANLAGDQYTNTTSYQGISVDFNVFSDAFVNASPAPLNELAALAKAWQRDMLDLSTNAADLVSRLGDDNALTLHTLYTEERQRTWHAILAGGK